MKYWIWLTRVNIRPITKYRLIEKYLNPKKIYNLNNKQLKSENLQEKEIYEILNKKYRENLEYYQKYMYKNNIELITINDSVYPNNLKNIYDPPIALYILGNKSILNSYSIAMVGCRDCSIYGENQAKKFSYYLAKNNIAIVSGLAKGIDKYSHIGCIAANGKAIAVLGNGLDIIYPKENYELARKIIQKDGILITEYPIGTKPNRENFPKRNRIISGISNSLIVIEAKIKSGSIITVDFALEQGKEVYALPGNITSKNSEGTNELIKYGAKILTKIEDINLELNK